MSKLFRALVISAVATGAAAALVAYVKSNDSLLPKPEGPKDGSVNADAFTEDERVMLTNELRDML